MAQNPAKRKCPSDGPENVTCMSETDVELDSFTHTWAISNFSFLSDSDRITSSLIRGGPKTKHGWKLFIRPKNKYDSVNYVSLYLQLFEYGNWLSEIRSSPVRAHFKMSILNADGGEPIYAFPDKVVNNFTKESNSWGQHRMITSADLVDPNRGWVVNDTVKIFCQVWIHGEIKEKVEIFKGRLSDEQRIKVCKDKLANDLGKMFSQSIATDCTVSTGKSSFKAHKAILSARSSVFAAMFNAKMMERETATVQIIDFDSEVVKGMLEYLYTGETTLMANRAQELLQIAEKYNLEGLKEDCEDAIGNNLNLENVVGVLVLAHTHNAPVLKSRAVSFINWNKGELLKLKSFQDEVKSFAHTGLFADLYLGIKK